jgi:hypothetical protein
VLLAVRGQAQMVDCTWRSLRGSESRFPASILVGTICQGALLDCRYLDRGETRETRPTPLRPDRATRIFACGLRVTREANRGTETSFFASRLGVSWKKIRY